MMSPRLFISALMILWGVSAYGGQVLERDPAWSAPTQAVGKVNPLAGRDDTAPGGRKLYRERCASCHAQDGRGSTKAPDLTQLAVQNQTDGALFWKLSSGNTRRGMPSFSFLPELQRWQLVQGLRSLP